MPPLPTSTLLPLHSFNRGQDEQHPRSWQSDHQFLVRVERKRCWYGTSIQLQPNVGFVSNVFAKDKLREDALATPAHSSSERRWDPKKLDAHVSGELLFDSPYISTSLSLMWGIYYATSGDDDEDVDISFIRIADLDPSAITIASRHLTRESTSWRFAHQFQEVLVYGIIPWKAIVRTVHMKMLRKLLPSWIALKAVPDYKYDGKMCRASAKAYAEEWANRAIPKIKLASPPYEPLARDAVKLALEIVRTSHDQASQF